MELSYKRFVMETTPREAEDPRDTPLLSNNGSSIRYRSDVENHSIFVGDLSPEIETAQLRKAFTRFGKISHCRVVRDTQTRKSKGYGFVSFVKKADAETAIATMNGQWLGSRTIRTNWATRKPPANRSQNESASKPVQFDEVYNQSSIKNTTVYCGGIFRGINDDLMQQYFSAFGAIEYIKVYKNNGYAFIRYRTKEAATRAIVAIHNTEIAGFTAKCSWGKEVGAPNQQPQEIHRTSREKVAQNWQREKGNQNPPSRSQIPPGQLLEGMARPHRQHSEESRGFQQKTEVNNTPVNDQDWRGHPISRENNGRQNQPVREEEPHKVEEERPHAVIKEVPHAVIEEVPHAELEEVPHAVIEEGPHAELEGGPHAIIEEGPHAIIEEGPHAIIEEGPHAVKEERDSIFMDIFNILSLFGSVCDGEQE